MAETIEQLITSVRRLRAEYDRALAINHELVIERRRIAKEIRIWARYGCNHAPAELRKAEQVSGQGWLNM